MGQIKNIKLHIVTDIKYTSVQSQSKQQQHGQIEEPHRPQPNREGSPQWDQETTAQQVPFLEGSRPQVPQESQIRQEAQQVRTALVSSWESIRCFDIIRIANQIS